MPDALEPRSKRRKLFHEDGNSLPKKTRPYKPQISMTAAATGQRKDDAAKGSDYEESLSSSQVIDDPPSDPDPGFREDDEGDESVTTEDAALGESSNDDAEDDDNDGDDMRRQEKKLRSISFGALADAQDGLPDAHGLNRVRRGSDDGEPNKQQKLQALKDRLTELRMTKKNETNKGNKNLDEVKATEKTQRMSKHAPTEQSSRHQVPRRREVVDTSHLYDPDAKGQKLQGDPRFNAAAGAVDQEKVRKNYAFLNDYAKRELQELKDTLTDGKKRKRGKLSTDEQARLQKEIGRRENRMKAEAQKERERHIAKEHKRQEKQKVKEGKRPFYLKRGKVKEEAEKTRWENLKAKDKQKAEQRKQKRQEQKEMKKMPGDRRIQ